MVRLFTILCRPAVMATVFAACAATPSSDAQATPKPQENVVLKQTTLKDPGSGGMDSHTLLAPKGWEVKGGGWWPSVNFFRILPSQDVIVTAPDGFVVRVGPGIAAVDFHPAPHLGMQRPAEGQADNGYPILYMPNDIEQWKTWLETKGIARSYPGATDIQVKQLVVIPELTTLLRKQLEPIRRLQEQNNQQAAQFGLGMRSSMDGVVYGATCTYEQDGKSWEHLFIFGVTQMVSDSQVGRQTWWAVEPNVSYRAPAGELDAKMPLMMTIANSVRPTPQWQKMKNDHIAKMSQIDAKGAADRSRIIAESNREISRIINDGYKERMATMDETHRKVINSIRGVDDYALPGGDTRVQLPNTYNYVYSNGNDEYILTNNSLYNPNVDSNINNRTWTALEPAK